MNQPLPKEAQEVLDKVFEDVQKVMDSYVGKVNATDHSLLRLKHDLLSCLEDMPNPDSLYFLFTTGKSPNEIVPANLYTALRMHLGPNSPPWEACKDGFWKADDGSEFSWKDGETHIKVAQPLNSITVSFTAGGTPTLRPQHGELFVYKNKAAFVSFEKGKRIDWGMAFPAFAENVGSKDPEDCFSVCLDANEWIGGVPYTWGLSGIYGARFKTYQLPGVPDDAVEFCHSELRRNRDVVGRIHNLKIKELIEFDCPQLSIP